MPDEIPQFVSTTLPENGEKVKRKVIRPRAVKTAEASKPRIRKPRVIKKELTDERNIEKKLTSIYEDGNGKIPDMKRIKIKRSHPFLGFVLALVILGGLVAAAAWAGFFVLPTSEKFSEEQIKLDIEGPQETSLGATSTYTITFKNTQKIPLKNVMLNINYPEGFIFLESSTESKNAGHTEWEIGTIGPNKDGSLTITGKPYGSIKQESSWRIFLNYQPENINSELQKVATYKTIITSVPVSLFVNGPDQVTIGTDAEFSFIVTRTGDWWPEKLELQPNFPDNFYIASSTPKLDKNNKWVFVPKNFLNASSSLETITFKVSGKFGETTAEKIPLTAKLSLPVGSSSYQIAESSLETNLIKNSVNVNLVINGSLKNFSSQPGDILNTTVNLKNTSKQDLNNGVVKLTFDAPVSGKSSLLNWIELIDKNDGLVRGENISNTIRRGEITWSYTQMTELKKIKSGQDISFDVRLPIKGAGIFDLDTLKEYRINVLSNVEFTDQAGAKDTISSNPITVTLNSDLKFENRDKLSTTGTKEAHDIQWVVTNNFHPLKNVRLTADVYGDVSWSMTEPAPAGSVNYDKTAKTIVWTIDKIEQGMDVLALPFTITLNQKNPTQDLLMSKVHVEAEDTVTGEKIDFMGNEISLIKPLE